MRLRKNTFQRKTADKKNEDKSHITAYYDLAGSKIIKLLLPSNFILMVKTVFLNKSIYRAVYAENRENYAFGWRLFLF